MFFSIRAWYKGKAVFSWTVEFCWSLVLQSNMFQVYFFWLYKGLENSRTCTHQTCPWLAEQQLGTNMLQKIFNHSNILPMGQICFKKFTITLTLLILSFFFIIIIFFFFSSLFFMMRVSPYYLLDRTNLAGHMHVPYTCGLQK